MADRRGFSLIELVIVVVIIGILGAIAIPRISRGSEGARINSFIAELNTFNKAIDHYRAENGQWPADSSSGVMPAELADYLAPNAWEGETPIGGNWDIEANDVGNVTLAVGVHSADNSLDKPTLRKIDALIDDGALSTGSFRVIAAGRFYYVLEE